MRSREQSRRAEGPVVTTSAPRAELGNECDAYLTGRYLEYARCHDLPLSAWMWLNEIAHGSRDSVVSAATPGSRSGWDRTTVVLAQAPLAATSGTDIRAIQQRVLTPLELELIGRTVTPRRLLELATSRLFDAEVPA